MIGDNANILYGLEKGISRNFIANCYLQNLADLWCKYHFYSDLRYVSSHNNPAYFGHVVSKLVYLFWSRDKQYFVHKPTITVISQLVNPPMAKGEGVDATTQQVFPIFLGNEKSFLQTKF